MALYLDGKPTSLAELHEKGWVSNEELLSYQNDHIFRVGLQFIKPIEDRDSPKPYWIAPVHVPCSYNFSTIDKGVRGRRGNLVWCESSREPQELGGVRTYDPPYIHIDATMGWVMVSGYEPEKNFFLVNHPLNEQVKKNEKHPNHDPRVDTIFSTYIEEKHLETKMGLHAKINLITTRLLDKTFDHKQLKTLSAILISEQTEQVRMDELVGFDKYKEVVLRERLLTVGSRYPDVMVSALESMKTSVLESIQNFQEAGILVLEQNKWYFQKDKVTRNPIVEVPPHKDAMQVIVTFFDKHDNNSKKFKELNAAYGKLEKV